jgi:AhpD family alkylhydroperoxidase
MSHGGRVARPRGMQARMKNPAQVIPEAGPAIQALVAAALKSDVSPKLLSLVHLRISQINGCSFCVDTGTHHSRKLGDTDARISTVAAWRHAPYFSEPERAALALAECVTRLSDRSDPVPDDVWNAAARHFQERELAALLLHIAVTNVFNRLNVPIGELAAGEWKPPT